MPRVSIHDTNKIFEVKESEVLYDALFDRGEELPHGCLSGSCGACRIEVIEGTENLVPAGAIEENTIDAIKEDLINTHGAEFVENKTIRLSCRAQVKGDVIIIPIK